MLQTNRKTVLLQPACRSCPAARPVSTSGSPCPYLLRHGWTGNGSRFRPLRLPGRPHTCFLPCFFLSRAGNTKARVIPRPGSYSTRRQSASVPSYRSVPGLQKGSLSSSPWASRTETTGPFDDGRTKWSCRWENGLKMQQWNYYCKTPTVFSFSKPLIWCLTFIEMPIIWLWVQNKVGNSTAEAALCHPLHLPCD